MVPIMAAMVMRRRFVFFIVDTSKMQKIPKPTRNSPGKYTQAAGYENPFRAEVFRLFPSGL